MEGDLGDGTRTNSAVPVPVIGDYAFSSIVAGTGFSCGLATSRAAYCWGVWAAGFAPNVAVAPTPVPGGHEFVQISAGGGDIPWTACGVTASHAIYCWGNNYSGQLGNGRLGGSVDCNGWGCEATPVKVAKAYGSGAELSFSMVTVGSSHACGLTTDGSTYCWGGMYNVPVAVGGGFKFATLSTGVGRTCGITDAGAAYCWGGTLLGRSDLLPEHVDSTPTRVADGLVLSSISTAGDHACAITVDHDAYCWGWDYNGALGSDTTAMIDCLPQTAVRDLCSRVPLPVSGGLKFREISAGFDHTCGVTTDGVAYCWGAVRSGCWSAGSDNCGELGTGGYSGSWAPVKVARQR